MIDSVTAGKHAIWALLLPLMVQAQVTPVVPNNTVMGNSSGSTAVPSALTVLPSGVHVSPASKSCTNTLVNPTTPSGSNTCTYDGFALSGTQANANYFAPYTVGVNDNYNGNFNNSLNPDALQYRTYNINSGAQASRALLVDNLNIFSGATLIGAPGGGGYVTHQINISTAANVGGTDLNGADDRGQLWASDMGLTMQSGATNYGLADVLELDSNLQAGSSVVRHSGLALNLNANSAVRGSVQDDAFSIGAAAGASTTYLIGIEFGGFASVSPLGTDSTAIGYTPRASQTSYVAPTFNYGIDFRAVNATSGYSAYLNAGTDLNGNVYGGNLYTAGSLTAVSGGVASISASVFGGVTGGAYYGSATLPVITIAPPPNSGTQAAATVATMQLNKAQITAPGSLYAVNDTITLGGAFTCGTTPQITVTGVNSGGITSVSVTTPGSCSVLVAAPTSSTTSGSGTGATFSFGFGILTVTVGTAGTGYPAYPLPFIHLSGVGVTGTGSVPAVLTATMSTATVPLILGSGPILPITTVTALPTCNSGSKGEMYAVSDATSPTYNATLTGSGTASIPVYCNGSAWTAH